jgi:hypothetical protein
VRLRWLLAKTPERTQSAMTDARTNSFATPPGGTPRWVWMLLILLIATLIAGIAGLLAIAGGADVPHAILTAGAAFGGAVALLLGLAHFLGTGPS